MEHGQCPLGMVTEVREARQIQKEFLECVTAATKIAYEKKEKAKQQRGLKLLELCKNHGVSKIMEYKIMEYKNPGGPVTPATIDILQNLTDAQLVTEIRCLRIRLCLQYLKERDLELVLTDNSVLTTRVGSD